MMSQIRIDTIAFDVRIAWQSVVFSILLTAVFAAIVNVVMYFSAAHQHGRVAEIHRIREKREKASLLPVKQGCFTYPVIRGYQGRQLGDLHGVGGGAPCGPDRRSTRCSDRCHRSDPPGCTTNTVS
ncbi:MAG: hypothetical protein ACLUIX_09700 [Oscillospiraceae bacterium]